MYCGQCGTRSPGGIRDGGRRSRRALHAAGGRIEVRGFGSFSLHFRPARAARNPRTGTPIVLPARYAPYFRPGKALRERVDRLSPEVIGDSGAE